MVNEPEHVPVLLEETLQALKVRKDGFYVDATCGRGGHTQAILEKLGPQGRVLALDRDPQAVTAVRARCAGDARIEVQQAAFSRLGHLLGERNLNGRVHGVLLDLGVSSPQLDEPARGFSFRHDGPLDMRMDPTSGVSAAQWINAAPEEEISRVLHEYGEERYARRIARVIVRERAQSPLTTTRQLAELIARAVPSRERSKDPATRSFQAIRIFINRELKEIEQTLPQAVQALASGGRLVVISFHSLEDRIVKRFLRAEAKGEELPLELPVRASEIQARLKLVGKAVRASAAEVQRNPRARSAVLRMAERTEHAHA
ncbi:MAG: 16S rRNA (cytosine(1402)-N(4))-methyltransferase RsmH [Pseudomonadota bacterium]